VEVFSVYVYIPGLDFHCPQFLTEKTVSQDISNGKENVPITAVNGEDFEMGPSGYV
jgi:hypothetical protein